MCESSDEHTLKNHSFSLIVKKWDITNALEALFFLLPPNLSPPILL